MRFSRHQSTNRYSGAKVTVRRGFTLVELIVAGVITAMVVGSVALSLGQMGRAKATCRLRTNAYLRADTALNMMRRDIISVLRSDDLFDTRVFLYDDSATTPFGEMDRDELLVFNTRLRPVRDTNNFNGEGAEYETQYRVEEDDLGPTLWQRRDALPDEYLLGGGVATPVVEGIVGLLIEAYDGEGWHHEWDSDDEGLPHAIRVTVTATGHRSAAEVYEKPPIMLRTLIPMDRVFVPKDHAEAEEEEWLEQQSGEGGTELGGSDPSGGAADGEAAGGTGGGSTGGGRTGGGDNGSGSTGGGSGSTGGRSGGSTSGSGFNSGGGS